MPSKVPIYPLRLPADLREALVAAATRQGCWLSTLIIRILREWLRGEQS